MDKKNLMVLNFVHTLNNSLIKEEVNIFKYFKMLYLTTKSKSTKIKTDENDEI